MRIRFADGRVDRVTDEAEAVEILRKLYPNAEFGSWESGRKLVWQDEDETRDDDGYNAVAEIVRDDV